MSANHEQGLSKLSIALNIEDNHWRATFADIEALISKALNAALDAVEMDEPQAEISLLLTDDAHQQALNLQWRRQDKSTNVLSFPGGDQYAHPDQAVMLGDVSLAYETCFQESLDQSKSFSHHVSHLLVHGMLHLLGYDHEIEAEAEEMESMEIEILQGLGIENPYADSA